MTNLIFVDAVAVVVLVTTAFFPRNQPIVLRLGAVLDRARDRRYRRRWLRLRAWEVQHPFETHREDKS